MTKATVLYGLPLDVEAFEKYYAEKHHPVVLQVKGIVKWEYTKFLPGPDGAAPAYYRMAELYFTSPEEMQSIMASPDGQTMAGDLTNFATGSVTILIGTVEK